MRRYPALLAATLAVLVALASPPAQARRSSAFRDTTYCRADGCFSRNPASGFYRHRLNADGGIARRFDHMGSRRSRY